MYYKYLNLNVLMLFRWIMWRKIFKNETETFYIHIRLNNKKEREPILMEDLKYPIGKYQAKKSATPRDVARWIDEIEELPELLESEISGLTDSQLDTPYRENGWTIRQIVHHLADSHMNGYIRIKQALTEDTPTLATYRRDIWAKMDDYAVDPDQSLNIIFGLHQRWTALLKSLGEEELSRECIHPDSGRMVVKSLTGRYAWHGKHHLAQIKKCKEQNNWN